MAGGKNQVQDIVCARQTVHQFFNLAVHMGKLHLQGGDFRVCLCRFLPARQRLVLLSYVNVKIAELDGRKQELLARIAELTVEAISPEQVSQISGYLDTWEDVSFDDKRRVVDLMITTIAATSDSLNITWKI